LRFDSLEAVWKGGSREVLFRKRASKKKESCWVAAAQIRSRLTCRERDRGSRTSCGPRWTPDFAGCPRNGPPSYGQPPAEVRVRVVSGPGVLACLVTGRRAGPAAQTEQVALIRAGMDRARSNRRDSDVRAELFRRRVWLKIADLIRIAVWSCRCNDKREAWFATIEEWEPRRGWCFRLHLGRKGCPFPVCPRDPVSGVLSGASLRETGDCVTTLVGGQCSAAILVNGLVLEASSMKASRFDTRPVGP